MTTKTISKTEAQKKLVDIKKQEAELLVIINKKEEQDFEKIESLEDACKVIGKNYKKFQAFLKTLSENTAAYEMLQVITEAINGENFEKWIDWDNSNQLKYYPWMEMRERSGSGFSCSLCNNAYTYSTVGSRLCFKSLDRLKYATKQFLPIYKIYFKK